MNPQERTEVLTLFGHSVGTTQTDKYFRNVWEYW
jgi:hypothetical protein